MEKHEIMALIDLLCERPLAERQTEPAAELQAFCREAAIALSQANDAPTRDEPDTMADRDRYTAALATLLSGSDVETARRTVAEATLRSAAHRLDAESALAFVDAIEQSPRTAPADLVEEMLAADRTDSAPREGAGASALWSLIAGGAWSARRWRMAAACMVVLVAGVASWSAYWPQTNPTAGESVLPMAKTTSEPRPVAVAPAPPRRGLATTQATTQAPPPCEPRNQANETGNAETSAPADAPKASASAGADCSATPGHEFADRPTGETEAMAARRQAEAARQAAGAHAAGAASKVDAAKAGREPIQADRSGPMFGTGEHRPAATLSAPAAAPAAARPAAPTGMK